jgi:hypothetical protein
MNNIKLLYIKNLISVNIDNFLNNLYSLFLDENYNDFTMILFSI